VESAQARSEPYPTEIGARKPDTSESRNYPTLAVSSTGRQQALAQCCAALYAILGISWASTAGWWLMPAFLPVPRLVVLSGFWPSSSHRWDTLLERFTTSWPARRAASLGGAGSVGIIRAQKKRRPCVPQPAGAVVVAWIESRPRHT